MKTGWDVRIRTALELNDGPRNLCGGDGGTGQSLSNMYTEHHNRGAFMLWPTESDRLGDDDQIHSYNS